ncbi:MAG: endonuclease [Flavobacterium sp.]|nr:endonuclease [Flavobacterium sp.]MBP8157412.1 endonuclease [Flavobacterium sp.]
MNKIFTSLLLLTIAVAFSQNGAPATPYYNGFNWNLTGSNLKDALATKITTTHTNQLTYSQTDNALAILDLDPADATNTNVLLVYGFSSNLCPASSSDDKDHRRRDSGMQDDGTASPCLYNREHTFPKALGNPDLGTSGPGADLHHLRASDKKRNADRDNDKFFNGSGNSFETGLNWYPGDEWKGDIARMMMYMYLRYGNQCLPTTVGVGTPVVSDANMIDLFLQWNADDPVSQFEDNRNTYLGNTSNTYAQGNRNPFIDNPYLATVIWGGPLAQNRWPAIFLSSPTFSLVDNATVYPNPTNNGIVNISSEVTVEEIEIITINGQVLQQIKNPIFDNNTYTISNLPKGFYFIKLSNQNSTTTKKVLAN